ncbi:MAG: tRNA threonylcarbamoyladenosine dehydratase [Elusimicrobiota bacterium]|jgi:tRNA A37 threonylcarbamoyladenosine dehydratase
MSEQDPRLSRVRLLLGEEGLSKVRSAFVTVVGLGAVGSYAAEALSRAGVGRLRLVDFDEIRPSNINRQIYALGSTVGRKKCEVARERVLDIQPGCRVEALPLFADAETMDAILEGPPDLVIDAIDSLGPKVELLCALRSRGIPGLSSMGAALRTDPVYIRTAPLAETRCCPLAARIRREFKRRKEEFPSQVLCVYSEEPVLGRKSCASLEQALKEESLERGRKRPAFGSLPTLTGIFGLTLANEAIRRLIGGKFPD